LKIKVRPVTIFRVIIRQLGTNSTNLWNFKQIIMKIRSPTVKEQRKMLSGPKSFMIARNIIVWVAKYLLRAKITSECFQKRVPPIYKETHNIARYYRKDHN
jgi:hypothetical protein